MTARRPPSQRDPDNIGQRLAHGLRAMSKGSDGGRVLNASPISTMGGLGSGGDAPDLDLSPAGDATSDAYQRDRFPSAGTLTAAASTLALTAVPASGSLHLYLNGLELDEGTDYTLSGSTVTVLTPAGTGSGDIIEARYAYSGVTVAGFGFTYLTDTFNRANSTGLGTADSGQTWIPVLGTANVVSNKAKFPSGADGSVIADSGVADGTFTVTIVTGASLTIDAAIIFRSNSTGSSYLFAQLFNDSGGTSGVRLAKTGGSPTGIVNYTALVPAISTTYTVQVIISGSAITVKINGAAVISYTLTSGEASTFTGSYAGIRISGSDNRSTFDDLSVVG